MKEKLDLKGKHINYNLNESKNRPECIYTVYLMLRKKYTYDFSSIQIDFHVEFQNSFCIPVLNGKCFV